MTTITTSIVRCKPFRVLMTCGHVETRLMREATAGVPFDPAATHQVTAGAPCEACYKAQTGRSKGTRP